MIWGNFFFGRDLREVWKNLEVFCINYDINIHFPKSLLPNLYRNCSSSESINPQETILYVVIRLPSCSFPKTIPHHSPLTIIWIVIAPNFCHFSHLIRMSSSIKSSIHPPLHNQICSTTTMAVEATHRCRIVWTNILEPRSGHGQMQVVEKSISAAVAASLILLVQICLHPTSQLLIQIRRRPTSQLLVQIRLLMDLVMLCSLMLFWNQISQASCFFHDDWMVLVWAVSISGAAVSFLVPLEFDFSLHLQDRFYEVLLLACCYYVFCIYAACWGWR